MIRNCCMLVAGLLLHTQIFAQDKTAASRTGEDYTLSNGAVEAVFSGSGSFDIEKLVLNGKQVVGAGKNETPWILIYKGSQGENPELKPEHAVYRGVQVRDDAQAKTLVFTWELTLDYSPVKYPVRMYVTLPDGGELLQWNIEADLPAGWLVTDLKFPNVVIERPEDGRIITTEGWGVEKPLDIATFEARYPSHASAMQFLVVHNAEGAFYYGTEDRRGCGKTYSAQCTPTTVALSDAIPASAGWIADGFHAEGLGRCRCQVVPSVYLHDRMGQQAARLAQYPAVVLRCRRVGACQACDRPDVRCRPACRPVFRARAGCALVFLASLPLRYPLSRLPARTGAFCRDGA